MNEIGDVGIDGRVVTGLRHVEKMVELSSGCICCSIDDYRFDLAIQEIIETAQPHLIIIESTGLADPEPLAYRVKSGGLGLDAIITVVDAANVERFLRETEVAGRRSRRPTSWSSTRSIWSTTAAADQRRAAAGALNPRAVRFRTVRGAIDTDVLFATDVAAFRERARVPTRLTTTCTPTASAASSTDRRASLDQDALRARARPAAARRGARQGDRPVRGSRLALSLQRHLRPAGARLAEAAGRDRESGRLHRPRPRAPSTARCGRSWRRARPSTMAREETDAWLSARTTGSRQPAVPSEPAPIGAGLHRRRGSRGAQAPRGPRVRRIGCRQPPFPVRRHADAGVDRQDSSAARHAAASSASGTSGCRWRSSSRAPASASTGIDVDERKVEAINAGTSYIVDVSRRGDRSAGAAGRSRATTDFSVIRDLDTINICVPTPLRKTKDPDLTYIVAAVTEIKKLPASRAARHPREHDLSGHDRGGRAARARGVRARGGAGLLPRVLARAHRSGQQAVTTRATSRRWSAASPRSARRWRSALYEQSVDTVVPVSSTRVAEMVKLLENTFRSVNIGLVNEIALMCSALKIDVWEVIDAAKTKPFGFMPFYPGPGSAGTASRSIRSTCRGRRR